MAVAVGSLYRCALTPGGDIEAVNRLDHSKRVVICSRTGDVLHSSCPKDEDEQRRLFRAARDAWRGR